MADQKLTYYLEKYARGKLTAEERPVLAELLRDPANAAAIQQLMDADWPGWEKTDLEFPEALARIQAGVSTAIAAERMASSAPRIQHTRRIHPLVKYAAAILIIGGIGAYFYSIQYKTQSPPVTQGAPLADRSPGAKKARLTLSDGTTITLDSAADGALAQQGNAAIIKDANGEIRYDINGHSASQPAMNTMTTPRGGQYKLMLPDGTKVWLNAASVITYPAEFTGRERRIKVSGEAYLEVAKNSAQPFIVDVDGGPTVQVLGTSFNINGYADEEEIRTTLIDGSIKVLPKGSPDPHGVLLRPGQQAVATIAGSHSMKIMNNADITQVLAWKNGIFNFQHSDLRSAMRQLERWYDIDVRYEGQLPKFSFSGEMDRGVMLSTVQRFLSDYGVHTRLENKTLIVEGQ